MPTNNALLTDAYFSPLRAHVGAAKRERYMAGAKGVVCCGFLLLLAALPLPSAADYKRCFKEGNTIEINDCLGDEFQKLHNELEELYQKTIKGLTADQGKALGDAQRVWIEFRDKDCRAVYEYWKAGSIRNTKHMVCRIEKTRRRIFELRKWPPY